MERAPIETGSKRNELSSRQAANGTNSYRNRLQLTQACYARTVTTDATNFSAPDFSALAASRRSTRAFTDREIPAEVLDEILADATTAPSWSNTRAFRVALATGERAQRLHEHYGRLFDEEIAAHARKAEDPTVEIPVADGDFPVRKRYPD